MEKYVAQLACDKGIAIDDLLARRIVQEAKTRRAAAYMTYSDWPIQRFSGATDDLAVFALWRLIAWDSRGGMRANFASNFITH